MSAPASSVPSALALAILARLSYEVRYAFLLYDVVWVSLGIHTSARACLIPYLFKSLMSRFLCFQIKKINAVKVFNTMH